MSDESINKVYTAYFDDSEGYSDQGNVFTAIGSVLIRQDLPGQIEAKLDEIWKKYLPGIDRMEFHATELEEATKWPFSTMADGEPLKMQREFIGIIGYADLPTVAVTIDNKAIQSNPMLGASLQDVGCRVLALTLSFAISIGSLIDVSRGEKLKLVVDKGLVQRWERRTIEQAISFLPLFAEAYSALAKKEGFVPSAAIERFAVDAEMLEVASHKLAGLQLADHVARYVFRNAKNPDQPDPRYIELVSSGLIRHSWKQVFGTSDLFPGVTVHIRPRKERALSPLNEAEEKTRLGKLQATIPQFRALLQDKFNVQRECPKCKSKLFWGSPTEEIQNAAEKGELIIVASDIQPENYCPQCKTLVFGASKRAKKLKKLTGQNGQSPSL